MIIIFPGGTIGLFTGVSLMSFVEVLYWIYKVFFNSEDFQFVLFNFISVLDQDVQKNLNSSTALN